METYQFSITWWILRFLSIVEVAVIIYLFTTTWKLSNCVNKTKEMISDLLQSKHSREKAEAVMESVEQNIASQREEYKRKAEND